MARPRNFDEAEVIRLAGKLFSRLGFNATSVDDLVKTTGLLRGSLYAAFGSKRNLFEKVLLETMTENWQDRAESVDLMIVALKELAPFDAAFRSLCRRLIGSSPGDIAHLLGSRLLESLER